MDNGGFVDIPGAKLFYRVLGPPSDSAPSLVVLHGGPGGSHDLLVPGIAALSEKREVIFYDQRGCGRSDRLTCGTSCTMADNIADLERLRVNLDLGAVDLMGHSWGGLLAMAYALDHGRNVRSLVLVAPAVAYNPNAAWTDFLATLAPEMLSEIAAIRKNPKRLPPARQAAIWRLTLREFFHNTSVLETIDLEKMPLSPEVNIRLARDLDRMNLRPGLRRLRIPTLILAGRHDRRLPLKYHEALAELLPDAGLEVLDHSGHFPFLEEPERFTEIVEGFLE